MKLERERKILEQGTKLLAAMESALWGHVWLGSAFGGLGLTPRWPLQSTLRPYFAKNVHHPLLPFRGGIAHVLVAKRDLGIFG